jgi:tetratricopeptide (TPR) repeat protein
MTEWNRWMATALVTSTLAPIGIWAQTISYSDLRNAGRAEYVAGRFAAAEDLLRRGLDRAVAAGDKATAATIDNDLGAVYISEERLQDAEQAYARGLALFKQMRDKEFEVAAILRNLGCTYSLQRRYEEARKTLDQAERLPIIRARGKDPKIQGLTAEIHNTQGIVHLRQGKLGKARNDTVSSSWIETTHSTAPCSTWLPANAARFRRFLFSFLVAKLSLDVAV